MTKYQTLFGSKQWESCQPCPPRFDCNQISLDPSKVFEFYREEPPLQFTNLHSASFQSKGDWQYLFNSTPLTFNEMTGNQDSTNRQDLSNGNTNFAAGNTISLLSAAPSNYFHCLVDQIGRMSDYLAIINSIGISNPTIALPLESAQKFSQLFDVDIFRENVLFLSQETLKSTVFENLWISRPRGAPGMHQVSSRSVRYIRNLYSHLFCEDSSYPERIYISRQKRGLRSIYSEETFFDILRDYKFSVVTLEDYDFKDQLNLFYNSKIVLGAHGAGFSNVFAARPDTLIAEVFNSKYLSSLFYHMSIHSACCYYAYVSDTQHEQDGRNLNSLSIHLQRDEFTSILDNVVTIADNASQRPL